MNRIKTILLYVLIFLAILLLFGAMIGLVGYGVSHIGLGSLFKYGILGIAAFFIIGLFITLIMFIISNKKSIGDFLGDKTGYLLGTNNGWALLFIGIFAAALVWEVIQGVRVFAYYMSHPVFNQATMNSPAPNLMSFGWFVIWTLLVLALGAFAVIFFPISRFDEAKEAWKRAKQRLDEASGGVLEAERPGFLERLKEFVSKKPAAPAVAVAAPVIAAGAPTPVAEEVKPAPPKPEGLWKKWGHWLAIVMLFLEEMVERGLFKRRKLA